MTPKKKKKKKLRLNETHDAKLNSNFYTKLTHLAQKILKLKLGRTGSAKLDSN